MYGMHCFRCRLDCPLTPKCLFAADDLSSLTALLQALSDLNELCIAIDDGYKKSLREDRYERWDEKS